ncbi:MAG: ABC transporter substrate-binding protein, partial [Oscillospiraceae bacterium]|nr:ABC transporter substrate-binding protein [Oscillospiraceae bacterium]
MKKILSLILALAMAASVAGCAAQPASGSASAPASVSAPSSAVSAPAAEKPTTDPSGAEVSIPDEIGSVVVLAPSIAETLVALGCSDLIVGYDAQSVGLEGLPADVPTFDMMQPDMEQLAALKPDVLFVSNMTLYDQTNPYQQLMDMGVCVL